MAMSTPNGICPFDRLTLDLFSFNHNVTSWVPTGNALILALRLENLHCQTCSHDPCVESSPSALAPDRSCRRSRTRRRRPNGARPAASPASVGSTTLSRAGFSLRVEGAGEAIGWLVAPGCGARRRSVASPDMTRPRATRIAEHPLAQQLWQSRIRCHARYLHRVPPQGILDWV